MLYDIRNPFDFPYGASFLRDAFSQKVTTTKADRMAVVDQARIGIKEPVQGIYACNLPNIPMPSRRCIAQLPLCRSLKLVAFKTLQTKPLTPFVLSVRRTRRIGNRKRHFLRIVLPRTCLACWGQASYAALVLKFWDGMEAIVLVKDPAWI
jgi:hypothetical protein